MSTGARTPATAQVSRVPAWTSTSPPLSPEQLLRSSGSRRPSTASALAREAAWLRAELARPDPDAGWFHPAFAARLARARRALACVSSPRVLADAHRQEALHLRPPGRETRAVRAAYALRWLELRRGVEVTWPPVRIDGRFGPPRVAAQPG